MARVLVVEDQIDMRELLRSILVARGHEVTTSATGVEALRLVTEADQPDLIVLDVRMPTMSGWETLRKLRKRFGDFGPKVMLCTVQNQARDLLHGWALGCDGYIFKPFDLDRVYDEIERVLGYDEADRRRVREENAGDAWSKLSENASDDGPTEPPEPA